MKNESEFITIVLAGCLNKIRALDGPVQKRILEDYRKVRAKMAAVLGCSSFEELWGGKRAGVVNCDTLSASPACKCRFMMSQY